MYLDTDLTDFANLFSFRHANAPVPGTTVQFCTVPKEIDFPRYNMKCSGENVILRRIFHVVSCFPLHYMLLYIAEIWITFRTVCMASLASKEYCSIEVPPLQSTCLDGVDIGSYTLVYCSNNPKTVFCSSLLLHKNPIITRLIRHLSICTWILF